MIIADNMAESTLEHRAATFAGRAAREQWLRSLFFAQLIHESWTSSLSLSLSIYTPTNPLFTIVPTNSTCSSFLSLNVQLWSLICLFCSDLSIEFSQTLSFCVCVCTNYKHLVEYVDQITVRVNKCSDIWCRLDRFLGFFVKIWKCLEICSVYL